MIITPNWPTPEGITALVSLRDRGNFATHVEDDLGTVLANRERLAKEYHLPQAPFWLNQIHSDKVIKINAHSPNTIPDADGSYTNEKGLVCAVLTADCLPVLLCDRHGQEIAALHAGWRGVLADIITRGVECFSAARHDIYAWLGPAIGPQAFEVGPEVYQAFLDVHSDAATTFSPSAKPGHYYLDIYALAKQYLQRAGIKHIYGGDYCTYTDTEQFFSYRREGKTGRMVSLIWRS